MLEFPEVTAEDYTKKVRTASALASGHTCHLPNLCQKHYYSSPLAQLHKLQESYYNAYIMMLFRELFIWIIDAIP